jgi:microcystin degradation protein MlrC
MRVFIAGLITETNSFAPFPTGWSGFKEFGIYRDVSLREDLVSPPQKVFRNRAEADGHEVIESITVFAQPSGTTLRSVYESLRDEILTDLANAMPVDMVLLGLHGAMMAQGYDDCEGDILARAREIAPDAVIGTVLDPHCHLTHQMLESADVITIVKEYPHIDFAERAQELYDICLGKAEGRLKPVAALVDTHCIGFYPTFDAPMSDLVADLRATEQQNTILSASIAHGFPWGDSADVGTRILIYADTDADAAKREAERIATRMYDLRAELVPKIRDAKAVIEQLGDWPGTVVLGESSDNPGGGAAGDNTFILRTILEHDIENCVIGAIYDPMSVSAAFDAGAGAELDLRIGGKSGVASDMPVDVRVKVMAVHEALFQRGLDDGQVPLGRSAWLRARGIDILICTVRSQVFHPTAFTNIGISMEKRRLIVVKSSRHFEAGFHPLADHLFSVSYPGAIDMDFSKFPYSKRNMDYFPRIADPWRTHGVPQAAIFA